MAAAISTDSDFHEYQNVLTGLHKVRITMKQVEPKTST